MNTLRAIVTVGALFGFPLTLAASPTGTSAEPCGCEKCDCGERASCPCAECKCGEGEGAECKCPDGACKCAPEAKKGCGCKKG
jgi:hypothetical protein